MLALEQFGARWRLTIQFSVAVRRTAAIYKWSVVGCRPAESRSAFSDASYVYWHCLPVARLSWHQPRSRKSAAAGLLLWARQAGDIDRSLHGAQQRGVRRANAGSAALSAYVWNWTQNCLRLCGAVPWRYTRKKLLSIDDLGQTTRAGLRRCCCLRRRYAVRLAALADRCVTTSQWKPTTTAISHCS